MNKKKIEKFLTTLRKNNLILYCNYSKAKIIIKYIGPDKDENKEQYLKSMNVYKKAKPYIVKNKSQLKEYFHKKYIDKIREVYFYDPRPELLGHKEVKAILKKAYEVDKDLYNTIHGLRSVGMIFKKVDGKIIYSYDKKSSFFKDKKDFDEKIGKELNTKEKKELLTKLLVS